ncbi:hypothetical protein SALBM135S_00949 [Streptomyces alboniger]
MYGFIGSSSVKSLLSFRSMRTVPAAGLYRTPQLSVVSPSRLMSPLASPPVVADSRKRSTWKEPAGAFHVSLSQVKTGPLTGLVMRRQVPSASTIGSVAVTQSVILRSPVVVFFSAG